MEKSMFKISNHTNEITEVKVVKETPAFIIIKGETSKRAKMGYDRYYNSFEEAHGAILKRLLDVVDYNKHALHKSYVAIEEFKNKYPITLN